MSGTLLLAAAIALKGATVHTAAGPAIANGVVVLVDGKIAAVGGPGTAVPAGATVVDVSGKHLSPAFFAPAARSGLVEIDAVRATNDVTEIGEVNPEARPDVAMNLDSETLPVTRSNGVLYAALAPSGSVMPGASSVVRLDGWTREDACVRCPAAIVVEWPNLAVNRAEGARPSPKAQEKRRDDALALLSRTFRDAIAYKAAKGAEGKPSVPVHTRVATLEALQPVLAGEIPLLIRADRKAQMEAAIRFADDELKGHPVRLVFVGAYDAPRLAEKLAARKIPVILDSILELPHRVEDPYDAVFAEAADLTKAGVLVAIGAGNAAAHVRDLPNHAAMAAAFGLDRLEALKTITANPATIFGVAARLGTLEPGKDASLAVWSGDPLQITSTLVALYEDGKSLDLTDRHKRLWEKYKNRPKGKR